MIRVVVADDQALVREGIEALLVLLDDVQVVGTAEDGHEAVAVIEKVRPDVVLLDLRMPGLDGVAVLRALKHAGRLPPTLVLTTFDDGEPAIAAIRAGAKGYMLKDVSLSDLAGGIRSLAAGGTAFHPALSGQLLTNVSQGRAAPLGMNLTPREREVLNLMAGGYSNREIAHALHLAEGTVKNHVSKMLIKLGARDRTGAVLKAIKCRHLQ